MVYKFSFYKTSRQVCGGPVSVDMIRTILRIIFNNKDCSLLPDRAFGQVFDKQTTGPVIIGYVGKGVGLPSLAPSV